ncbi:hypothetical protein Pla108_10110 [Botrimarina colliarenosi]|uniref:Uncharacterized protein n=1 Tax=Botrimarina colliarenosi TaxID=2528001 RepID=A0A5C6AKT6_9BACT|nr:hypothetical protein [Botrimarina colliarenosi]TWU00067.1 hypothetical protein Pla108_10110 [Botrimarina colliarenosi]
MLRTTLTAAVAALLTAPAAADHLDPLLGYTGQVRGQMALVRAQAHATFDDCSSARLIADDVYDELDRLCRELDRLELLITRPIPSRTQVRLIDRALHRLDEQAGDVEDAVREALADPRRHAVRHQPAFRPHGGPIAYSQITTHTVGHRGVRLVIGGGNFGVTIGSTNPTPRVAFRPTHAGRHGVGDPDGDALCGMTDNLRLMTRQLLALYCQ